MNPSTKDTARPADSSLEDAHAGYGVSRRDRAWIDGRQLCDQTDPSIFFGDAADHDEFPSARAQGFAARRVCRACPLRRPCLAYALEGEESGTWGGTGASWRAAARARIRDGSMTLSQAVDSGIARNETPQAD